MQTNERLIKANKQINQTDPKNQFFNATKK